MEVTIRSGIGKIEAFYHHSKNAEAPTVIIVNTLSPNETAFIPTVDTVYDIFVKRDFSVLKFSFSNVKETNIETKRKNFTEKQVSYTEKQLLCLTSIVDWLHSKNIDCRNFWLVAFGVSTYYGLQLVMRRPEIENYILVSPLVPPSKQLPQPSDEEKKKPWSFLNPCSASGAIFRGEDDIDFTDEDCLSLQDKLATKTTSMIKVFTIYGADGYYSDKINDFKNEIENYVDDKLSQIPRFSSGILYSKRRRRRRKKNNIEEEKPIIVNPIKDLVLDNI